MSATSPAATGGGAPPPCRTSRLATVARRAAVAELLASAAVSSASGATARRRRRPAPTRRGPRRPRAAARAPARGERGAGADPDRPPHAQLGQVGQHQRGARPAHPGRLDRQRPARRRLARVAPQPAGVVAHLRLLEQLLGQQQRPPGVADEERGGGDRGGGAESGRHRRRRPSRRATPRPTSMGETAAADFLQPSKGQPAEAASYGGFWNRPNPRPPRHEPGGQGGNRMKKRLMIAGPAAASPRWSCRGSPSAPKRRRSSTRPRQASTRCG